MVKIIDNETGYTKLSYFFPLPLLSLFFDMTMASFSIQAFGKYDKFYCGFGGISADISANDTPTTTIANRAA
jgi:hypothetical protein